MSSIKSSEAKFLFEISGMAFHVVDFIAHEKISSPFEVNLNLASEDEVNFDDVINKETLLTILSEEADRYFHGIISRFMQTGSKGRFFLYRVKMVPSLWLLSLEQDCRIFQKKNVQEIVQAILEEDNIPSDRFDFRLQDKYQPREYCVQYRETDLNFISRLLEEEGIFYFFEHDQDKHLLVFGDSTVNYQSIQGEATVSYHIMDTMVPEKEVISNFIFSKQIRSGKVTLKDFDFEKPSMILETGQQNDTNQNLEIYDYPGEYSVCIYDYESKKDYTEEKMGKRLAQLRLQEAIMFQDKAEGKSGCPRFIPGFKFNLKDHDRDDFNQEYLLIKIIHKGTQPQVLEELAESGPGFSYSNDFIGITSSTQFRPERKTPKPVVKGVQTAIVVGPETEEIYTDEYGRVKVKFHWYRKDKKDQNGSCWIRVSQIWAGAGWGAMFIPRIKQEVLVDFIEGDPDRPIITGRVYCGTKNDLPLKLPDEKTKSTIKSNSSKGGDGSNEIRFEDKKGEEQVFIHAQKDMSEAIENNMSTSVGGDRTLTVKNNRTTKIDEGEDKLTVATGGRIIDINTGDHKLTVKTGNRIVDVNTGDDKLTVKTGHRIVDVNAKDDKLTVKTGNHIVSVNAGNDELKVLTGKKSDEIKGPYEIKVNSNHFKITCGSSKLTFYHSGKIEIEGSDITLKTKADIKLQGANINSEAKVSNNIKGTNVLADGKTVTVIKGGMVQLNP